MRTSSDPTPAVFVFRVILLLTRLLAHVLVLFPPVFLLARLAAVPHELAPAAPLERRVVGTGRGLVAVGAHADWNFLPLDQTLALSPTTGRGTCCGGR